MKGQVWWVYLAARAVAALTVAQVRKRSPQDFTISKPLGEGAYSTVMQRNGLAHAQSNLSRSGVYGN